MTTEELSERLVGQPLVHVTGRADAREATRPGGTVIVVDERTAESSEALPIEHPFWRVCQLEA